MMTLLKLLPSAILFKLLTAVPTNVITSQPVLREQKQLQASSAMKNTHPRRSSSSLRTSTSGDFVDATINHEFTHACTEALISREDVSKPATKTDLEDFLKDHQQFFAGGVGNDDYSTALRTFEHLSPIVQFYFARATCGGEFPSIQVCSGAGASVDPTEHITIPAGNEETVQSLCTELDQFM